MRELSVTDVRRVAVAAQCLSGPRPAPNMAGMREVLRAIRCLQLDPISVVARSHMLVLFSRLGRFDPADLDRLLWEERWLFEYWAHAASMVLTEDYPIHRMMMEERREGDSTAAIRSRTWIAERAALHTRILERLAAEGPLPSRAVEDEPDHVRQASHWYSGRDVPTMLGRMWTRGEVMVAGRVGQARLWDLAERCLPEWAPHEPHDQAALVRRAAELALRALGVATATQIRRHFTRNRYPGLATALRDLEADGRIVQVRVAGDGRRRWAGPWYAHPDALALLDAPPDAKSRTTLLSPFDNLICDRDRTETLWDFRFRIEIYVPRDQRTHGYYVLPVLHGDDLIGRVDSRYDRKAHCLTVHALHSEPDAPAGPDAARRVSGAIEELAAFLGARDISYSATMPGLWQTAE